MERIKIAEFAKTLLLCNNIHMSERPSGMGGVVDRLNPLNSNPVRKITEGTRSGIDSLLNLPFTLIKTLTSGTVNTVWKLLSNIPLLPASKR
jgi:hypothetical protein